ncbi:MAG: hypothetical protein A2Y73_07435 [Chloroflexi bacterium RBG_13_56_8]|nr:MAG: hypothetical protein A2Y73_07435 [Chloroflexi bacterium RBG_13_56_8]
MFENVRVCLFDFDGTLIRPSIDFEWIRQVVLAVVDRYGVDTEVVSALPILEIIDRVTDELSKGDVGLSAAFRREAQQALIDVELEAANRADPYVGVPEMLTQLRDRGFGVAIVTRNCRAAVERILARNTLHYDVLLTRDDVDRVKPDPHQLLAALEALGESATQALMCGDHPMDIIAGQRVGAHTVAVMAPGSSADRFDGLEPDLIVSMVTELLEYLPVVRCE